MWYVRDVLYAVLHVRVSCFVVRGCGVSRRYIDVCYCDMFSVVNVYFDHLKFCVVCINSRRYVCCSECDVVSNECNGRRAQHTKGKMHSNCRHLPDQPNCSPCANNHCGTRYVQIFLHNTYTNQKAATDQGSRHNY